MYLLENEEERSMKKAMAAAGLILTLVLQAGTAVYAAPDGDGGAPEQLDYTAPLQYELESAGTVEDPEGRFSFLYNSLLDRGAEEPALLSSSGETILGGLDDLDYLGGGLYTARTPLEEDNVNTTGLYTSDGETLIPAEAASIVLPYNREQDGSARFLSVIYTTGETESEEDCIIYFTSNLFSLSIDEEDVMYTGYYKVYDVENRQFVPDLELTSIDRNALHDLGDSFLLQSGGAVTQYAPDGSVLFETDGMLTGSGYHSYVVSEDGRYTIRDSAGNVTFTSGDYESVSTVSEPLDYYSICDGEGDLQYHLIDMSGNRILKDPQPVFYEASGMVFVTRDGDNNSIVLKYDGTVAEDAVDYYYFPLGGYGVIVQEDTGLVSAVTPDGILEDLESYDESRLVFTKEDKVIALSTGAAAGSGFAPEDIGNVLAPGLVSVVDPSSDRYADPKIALYDILSGEELLPGGYQDIEMAGDYVYANSAAKGEPDKWEVYKVRLVSEAGTQKGAAAEGEEASAEEEEAIEELKEEDEKFGTGTINGQAYEQAFFGFRLDLEDDWSFSNEEQLAQLQDSVSDLAGDQVREALDSGTNYIDMYAEDSTSLNNINANITRMSMSEALGMRIDQKHVLKAVVPLLTDQFASMGFADTEGTVSETEFLGQTVPCIELVSYYEDENGRIPIYQKQVYVQKGTYLLTLTSASYVDDHTQDVLDDCSPL